MAVLEKIRVKFGIVITVVIALALLSFIIDPTTLQNVSSSMSSKYDVGKINGKSISYQEFQQDVEKMTTINEIITGGAAGSEQQQEVIRNSAWQALVDKFLFVKTARAAGIEVGDSEMLALTTGDMLSPIMAQNPVFLDENGNLDIDKCGFVTYSSSDHSYRSVGKKVASAFSVGKEIK